MFLSRFQGIPGVEVYQSLRIPDPGHRGRREVDIVLLTKRSVCNNAMRIALNAKKVTLNTRPTIPAA